MRVCDAFANETLTRKHRCHLLGGFAIGARQQMRIAIEHGTWVVPEAGGDDVNGDSMHEHQSRGRMPERVQSPARDLCPPTQLPKAVGEPLGADRAAELVAIDKIPVLIGIAGERALDELPLAVLDKSGNRSGVERDHACATFGFGRAKRASSLTGDELLRDCERARLGVERAPGEPQKLTPPHSAEGAQPPECKQAIPRGVLEKAGELAGRPRLCAGTVTGGRIRLLGRVASQLPPADGIFQRPVENSMDEPSGRRGEPLPSELLIEGRSACPL
jgi:hypothetical protein